MVSSFERQILFRKYLHLGFQPEEADSKIKSFCDYLKTLKVKFNKIKMPEEDINLRCKREFEKLCMRLDGGNDWVGKLDNGVGKFKQ